MVTTVTENKVELDHHTQSKKTSNLAFYGLMVTGGLAAGLSIVTASFIAPALRRVCLPFVPATSKQVNNVLKLCKKTNGISTLVDLGSGDGRIVFAAAREGYLATGYELNPWLVLYSKVYAPFYGLKKNALFQRKDLWKVDLSQFDNIVIFGVAEMMDNLAVKLEKEMNAHARVVACRFAVQKWTPVEEIEDGIDSVWLYTKDSFKNN